MITLRELLKSYWYVTNIIITENTLCMNYGDKFIEDIKKESLFYGENYKTRSEEYRNLLNRYVRNYSAIDNWFVIELYR